MSDLYPTQHKDDPFVLDKRLIGEPTYSVLIENFMIAVGTLLLTLWRRFVAFLNREDDDLDSIRYGEYSPLGKRNSRVPLAELELLNNGEAVAAMHVLTQAISAAKVTLVPPTAAPEYEHPKFTVYEDAIGPFYYTAHYQGLPDIVGEGETSHEAEAQLKRQYANDAEYDEPQAVYPE